MFGHFTDPVEFYHSTTSKNFNPYDMGLISRWMFAHHPDKSMGVLLEHRLHANVKLMGTCATRNYTHALIVDDLDYPGSEPTGYFWAHVRAFVFPENTWWEFIKWYGEQRMDVIRRAQHEHADHYGRWDATPMGGNTWRVSCKPQRRPDGTTGRFNSWDYTLDTMGV